MRGTLRRFLSQTAAGAAGALGVSAGLAPAASAQSQGRVAGANRRVRVALIGCGGVSSGAEAYAKIRAGACAVQLYTALVYHGVGLVGRIKKDLARRLRADGFVSVADAVGAR